MTVVVENLSKSFGSRTLWSDVSFTVEGGEMLALVGPSGAGKSTLLNCIGLLEKTDGGEIRAGGSDVTRFGRRASRRFRRDSLGYLFQNYALIDNATISDNLDIVTPGLSLRRRNREYETFLKRVGLAGRAEEKVYRLSGGEQQRVALARLMVKRPTLILADEPTGALDERNEEMVLDVLRQMATEGAAVIIATHRDRVRAGCDSVFEVSGR